MLHTLTLLALFINFTTAFSFSETQNHGITCGKPIISSKFSPKLLQIDPKTLKPRVVGGKDYTIENHPWNVLLLLGTETDPYDSICGGSVISNDWIITAGHCTNEATEDYSKAVIGKTQIETDFQKYSQNSYGYPIQKMYTHPDYDNSMTNNDIGLLRLAQTLTFSRQIQPICLPKNIICLQKDTKVTITGWGSTTKDGQSTSPTLQGALLPVKSAEYCTEKYKTSYLQETMTCAANGDGIDACDGDSGSPLVFKDSSGVSILYGINSWSNMPCASDGFPGVYVRVSNFLEWIYDVSGVTSNIDSIESLGKCCDEEITTGVNGNNDLPCYNTEGDRNAVNIHKFIVFYIFMYYLF